MKPFNFKEWIAEHRHLLKPPVGNKLIFHDSTFIVMVVGGPNERTDFHVNQTDEFFYQLEGDMVLKIIGEKGSIEDIPIREGDIFMLGRGIPHSPQRPAGSIGLVVEKTRERGEMDGFQWYCEKCFHKLYEEFCHISDVENQLDVIFERYYGGDYGLCPECGHGNGRKWGGGC